jgi:WS/DGAT/MGAT family acyltransferase
MDAIVVAAMLRAVGDVLTALDATFLELEELKAGALMSIGGVMVFEPAPDRGAPSLEEICDRLEARLASLPRYLQRLSAPETGALAWPHWETDERFDVRDHVRRAALPAPGGDAELCDFTAELFSHPLDRARPLWELVLVEGLDGGGWALAHKIHHCLVDGVGAVDIVTLLLDGDAGAAAVAAKRPSTGATSAIAQAANAGRHGARAGLRAALHPREAYQHASSLANLIVRDEFVGAPNTSLNVPIGQTRRYGVVRIPLAELRAIGHGLGGSVNDVVLAASATGLRRLLLSRGEQLPAGGLRAMVPVNMREESGRLELGNRVSALFVDLPVAPQDPRGRLRAIAAATSRLKRSGGAVGASTLVDLAALVPPIVVRAALTRTAFSRRLFNLTVTNVPGPQRPLYAFGCQLRELQPVVPLAADHAVGVAVFSYDGLVTFGINADADSVPDLAEIAYGIKDGVHELLALTAHDPALT